MSTDHRPSKARVRELCSTDHARWDELWAGYLQFYKTTLAPEVTEETWRRLIDSREQPYGFVALDTDDRVIGFVHYHYHLSTWAIDGYCYLEDLFVDPASRGTGAGRALIEAVYRAANERGVTRVYWHTENDNTRAQALYNQVAVVAPFIQYRSK